LRDRRKMVGAIMVRHRIGTRTIARLV